MTILTEKENVAKNYAKALGLKKIESGLYADETKKIKICYAAGHLYNLYDAQDYDEKFKKWNVETLPIIREKYLFKPVKEKYNQRKDCEKILREAVRTKDEIVVATDPDREGEVIANLILEKIGYDRETTSRIWCCEGLDEKQIRKGIDERKSVKCYEKLMLQGKYQKISDWVFGINLTRCYSILNNELFTVGRVQTAVLKEIYRREKAILLFRPIPYYKLSIKNAFGTKAYLINPKTGDTSFESEEEVKALEKEIEGKEVIFDSEKREKTVRINPRLYDLASLQKDSFDVYGIDVDETLEIAQCLYNEEGAISYPRTESVCLNDNDFEYARKIYREIALNYKDFNFCDENKINAENKRLFNSNEVRGHHGIIPSGNYKILNLSDRYKNVYDLVCRRFLMQGMGNYEFEIVKAYYRIGKYYAVEEGKETVRKGWIEASLKRTEEDKVISFKKDLNVKETETEKLYTKNKEHYTQSTILSFMRNPKGEDKEGIELKSIGTEATQAGIIKKLFEVGYICKKGKHIEITDKGIKICEQLMENPIVDVNTDVDATTKWEEKGREDPFSLLKDIEEITFKSIDKVRDRVKKAVETRIEKEKVCSCKLCGSDIYRGKSSFYCSGYKDKECKVNIGYKVMGNDITEEDIKMLMEEGRTALKEGVTKSGEKTGFMFVIDEEKKEVVIRFTGEKESVCECPLCKKSVVRMAKVYKCTNKECSFFMWKDSSGISYEKEDIKKLCNGEKISKEQTKKNGEKVKVKVCYDREKGNITISY